MKCGEFDLRNDEYNKVYSDEGYFSNLIYNDKGKYDGSGKIIFDV